MFLFFKQRLIHLLKSPSKVESQRCEIATATVLMFAFQKYWFRSSTPKLISVSFHFILYSYFTQCATILQKLI